MKKHSDIIHEVGAENPDTGIFSHDDCHRMLITQRDEFLDLLDRKQVNLSKDKSPYHVIDELRDAINNGNDVDSIDYSLKKPNIAYIKKVIAKFGTTTCSELGLDSSPCLHSFGNGKN